MGLWQSKGLWLVVYGLDFHTCAAITAPRETQHKIKDSNWN